jgi:hypothetical protein
MDKENETIEIMESLLKEARYDVEVHERVLKKCILKLQAIESTCKSVGINTEEVQDAQ